MTKFLVYLFESGVCLSLLYFGYIILLRKETYFNLIRIYLILTIVLALVIPLIPLNIKLSNTSSIKKPVENIEKFKSYYYQLIYMTDPFYSSKEAFEALEGNSDSNNLHKKGRKPENNTFSIAQKIILLVYLSGIIFLFIRFVYLFLWLNKYSGKRKQKYCGINLYNVKENIPSFSFFNNVYINKEFLSPIEFEQVFTHEKVHVEQKHSIDIILAQFMILFQWFNPLVWILQKSMKTVHEYIADRKVMEQGYQLFDYQSLLLSQLISIRSVDLVNNFNLLSIKKRIAMMNKIKSGFAAKLKAFIAVPLVLVVFFLFVDMKAEKLSTTESFPETDDYMPDITINRPSATQYKEVNLNEMFMKISFDSRNFFIDGELIKKQDLFNKIKHIKETKDAGNSKLRVSLDIDKNSKMADVNELFSALRENDILKLAYLVNPLDNKVSEKSYYAVYQVLPPKEANFFDYKEIKDEDITIYSFEIENKCNSGKLKKDIRNLILENEKYMMIFDYSESTLYNNYILVTDAIYSVFYDVRSEASRKETGKNINELSWEEAQPYIKKYPITLTKKMSK